MSEPLVEISLNLADQLEAALLKEASLQDELSRLKEENKNLTQELHKHTLTKKASEAFDVRMLSATTALENAGFFAAGTAVTAYKALTENPKEIPILLEKLAAALQENFNEGSSFYEDLTKQSSTESEPPNPWRELLD